MNKQPSPCSLSSLPVCQFHNDRCTGDGASAALSCCHDTQIARHSGERNVSSLLARLLTRLQGLIVLYGVNAAANASMACECPSTKASMTGVSSFSVENQSIDMNLASQRMEGRPQKPQRQAQGKAISDLYL